MVFRGLPGGFLRNFLGSSSFFFGFRTCDVFQMPWPLLAGCLGNMLHFWEVLKQFQGLRFSGLSRLGNLLLEDVLFLATYVFLLFVCRVCLVFCLLLSQFSLWTKDDREEEGGGGGEEEQEQEQEDREEEDEEGGGGEEENTLYKITLRIHIHIRSKVGEDLMLYGLCMKELST